MCFHVKSRVSTDGSTSPNIPVLSRKVKKNMEVSLRKCTAEERAQFEDAKAKEIDSWLSTEAIIPVLAKGIPLDRIMRMRWVLTWKDPPEEAPDDPKKAKARLVVLGYTDPDLVDVP